MKYFFIISFFLLGVLESCVHHTKCPTYANSGVNRSKRASCPTYANSGTSNGRAKRASCPANASSVSRRSKRSSCPANAAGFSSRAVKRGSQSCPAYASSTPSARQVKGKARGASYKSGNIFANKEGTDGMAPWTKKAKEQDKKKPTSGLLPGKN